jgi:hypothetical protein
MPFNLLLKIEKIGNNDLPVGSLWGTIFKFLKTNSR